MENLCWKERRTVLKTLTAHSTESSNLKRKQAILNRLKNISNEDFFALLSDLEHENFNKFHTEIVNNLLNNPMIVNPSLKHFLQVFSEVHKITEVIYLFSFDNLLFSYLIATLKKSYSQNWALSCIYIEVYFLNSKIKKPINYPLAVETVTVSLIKHLKDSPIGVILYTLEYFDVNLNIFEGFIKHEANNANLDTIEAIRRCSEIVGMVNEIHLDDRYVPVITPLVGEFDFYEEHNNTNVELPAFSLSLIKNIEKKNSSAQLLDFIGQNVYDKPDLVMKLLKKKRKLDFIPSLARILVKCCKNRKSLATSIISCFNTESDLVLIAEIYKFNIISSIELFNIMHTLIEHNQIEKLCTILYSVGRFILYKKDTNSRAIALFDRIRNSQIDEISKIAFTHCVSVILNPDCSKMDILDFFRWTFKSKNFDNSELFNDIKQSKQLLLFIFAQPGIFEQSEDLYRAIERSDMLVTMENFYLNSIGIVFIYSKVLALDYVYALGTIVKSKASQISIINGILSIKIDEVMKYKIILILLDVYDKDIHSIFLPLILEKSKLTVELSNLVFNFCEKYNQNYLKENNDSFDRDLLAMYDSD